MWRRSNTPELAIAVFPGFQGQGFGTQLLDRLLRKCDELFPSVVLSVRDINHARRLCERFGFEVVDVIANRVRVIP